MLRIVKRRSVSLGCDPEFFFSKNGRIIGAEKVIAEKGIENDRGTVIIDGVQAELNPQPNTCRESLCANISSCFVNLYQTMSADKKLKVDFSSSVKVSKSQLASLKEKNRKFGCKPSKNTNGEKNDISLVDAETHTSRSAGGHIHLGKTGDTLVDKALTLPKRLVPLLDILLGNTAVLMDRDEGNIERRKLYGMAGEYRTPKHGLEYRVLSNFWLRSYTLSSFVFGMARFAVEVLASTLENSEVKKGGTFGGFNVGDVVKVRKTYSFNNSTYHFKGEATIITNEITARVIGVKRKDNEAGSWSNYEGSALWKLPYVEVGNLELIRKGTKAEIKKIEEILYGVSTDGNFEKRLLNAVNMLDIEKAINENDYDLAMSNFLKIVPIIMEITKGAGKEAFPLMEDNLEEFAFFLKKPIEKWFPQDPLEHWTKDWSYGNKGWGRFLSKVVAEERFKSPRDWSKIFSKKSKEVGGS